MKIAVIGAGMAGLAAARNLQQNQMEVVVFEKSRGVGGRVATRRHEGFTWDTGATSITPRGKLIEDLMLHQLDTSELVQISLPIYTHIGLRVSPGDTRRATLRYTYRTGNSALPKLLENGLNIRLETQVDAIEADGKGYRVLEEYYDGVVLTPPVPQTSALLWSLGESRALAGAKYRACLSVLLGFASELPATPYYSLLDSDQRHPLTWLSLESRKSPDRAPEGHSALCAQLNREFTQTYYEAPDAELVRTVSGYVERLYGPSFAVPVASSVMRWKYSQPETTANFENVNPAGSTLVIASDGILGGHVEDAYEVGVKAAMILTASLAARTF